MDATPRTKVVGHSQGGVRDHGLHRHRPDRRDKNKQDVGSHFQRGFFFSCIIKIFLFQHVGRGEKLMLWVSVDWVSVGTWRTDGIYWDPGSAQNQRVRPAA